MFFLKKIRTYILPYGDILAWCLMPNHFHFMVLVKETEVNVERYVKLGVSLRHAESINELKLRSFNDSIGIMLMAYSKAINKQQNRTGKLFREETKAECINCPNGITPSFYNENGVTKINIHHPEKQYPQICFNYIHQNPVKAGLVDVETDWEFSSAMDYAGLRSGKLVNKNTAEQFFEI